MEIMVKKEVKQYVDEKLKITSATLLSAEAANLLSLELRKYNTWWWVRSSDKSFHNTTAVVNNYGTIFFSGYSVNRVETAIRPILQLKNLNSSNLQIGDVFIFGGKRFKVISNNLAFCLADIGKCCFRADCDALDANNYEKSDVKKYIEDWFKMACHE